MGMPEFKAPETFDPNNWGGMAPAAPRKSMSPEGALATAQARRKSPSAQVAPAPQQAIPTQPQATEQPFSAPNADRYRDIAENPNGGNASDAQWSAYAQDFRKAAPGQSVNEYLQGNPGAVQTVNVSPASGSYNPENVRIQRDQDAYWGARKDIADAKYALANYTDLSPQDRAMYTAQIQGGNKGLEGMRTDDTARRGQDTTRYGYDQQRGTGQDRNTAEQKRQDTDPTKPAGAIASLQQGEYYGAQADQVGLANEAAKRIQALHQQFTAEQDPAKKASLLENIRSLSPNPEKRYMHVAGGMDMNGNKLPDVVFDTVTGKPVGGAASSGVTKEMIDAKVKDPAERQKAYAHYGLAQGGAVGYAQGGEITSPLADPMQQVHPMVGEYRRYSMMAQQLGATPVSFEQFGALRQSAATQGHQVAPMQENFASGGAVDDPYKEQYAAANRSLFTYGLEQAANKDINTDVYSLSHRGANGGRIQDRAIEARKNIDLEQQGKARAQTALEAFTGAGQPSGGSNIPLVMGGSTNPYGNAPFDTGSLNHGASMNGWERTSGYAEGGGIGSYGGEAVRRRMDAAEAQAMGGVQNISAPAQAPAQRAPTKSYDQIDADIAAARAKMNKPRNFFGFAEGGEVGAIPVGGRQVLGPGDGKSDSIPAVIDGKRPAALSTGEFVFPVEAVRHFGMDRLNKMVEAARKPQGA